MVVGLVVVQNDGRYPETVLLLQTLLVSRLKRNPSLEKHSHHLLLNSN